jgi:hypothetical protein
VVGIATRTSGDLKISPSRIDLGQITRDSAASKAVQILAKGLSLDSIPTEVTIGDVSAPPAMPRMVKINGDQMRTKTLKVTLKGPLDSVTPGRNSLCIMFPVEGRSAPVLLPITFRLIDALAVRPSSLYAVVDPQQQKLEFSVCISSPGAEQIQLTRVLGRFITRYWIKERENGHDTSQSVTLGLECHLSDLPAQEGVASDTVVIEFQNPIATVRLPMTIVVSGHVSARSG